MADFGRYLGAYKQQIDKELERHFNKLIQETEKEDRLMAESLRQVKKIALAGGKRIRGALLMVAYFGAGGKEKRKILKVAAAIELVHVFLLVHDDIIDRGKLRHGEKALHDFFAGKKWGSSDGQHFGESVGIITGEMLYVLAIKIITEAGFDCQLTLDAIRQLQIIVKTTIIGQSQDIAIEHAGSAKEKDVLRMYGNKTARYTFEGPLHIGMKLAGCSDKKTYGALSKYSLPLGIAFQAQDDILGVFGSEEKTGKSAVSDIQEGKISILVVKARELGSSSQNKILDSILGKSAPTKKEIAEFRKIITDTGALGYARDMAEKNFTQGKKEIEKAIILKSSKDFLMDLVEYLQKRNH